MKLNQKGISLVELLAGLALVGIVAVIAWTAMTTGFKHSAVETSKTRLQQEVHYIITTMNKAHQRNDHYYFRKNMEGHLELNTCNGEAGAFDCSGFQTIADKDAYSYTGFIEGVNFDAWDETMKIEPKKAHTDFQLTVSDSSNEVSVTTKLTRLITSMK